MSEEKWLPVPGFEFYEISDQGRLRNLGHFHRFTTGDSTEYRFPHGRAVPKVLKLSRDKSGYPKAILRGFDQQPHYFRIHQLVVTVFLGCPPSKAHVVHHKDGDRMNNQSSNLEWVTPKEHKQRHKKVFTPET